MRSLLLAVAVLPVLPVLPAAAPRDGWKDLRGKEVPEIHVQEWLGVEDAIEGVADLQGKVWLLEFFATW